jgi:hypothetical protein
MQLATGARLALAAALLPLLAGAQDRPSEGDLFGPVPTAAPTAAKASATTAAPADERAGELLGSERAAPEGRIDAARDNPLAIGGLLYLRTTATFDRGVPPSRWPIDSPNLLDVFLDARPNDRVRGMALGRLTFDPTLAQNALDLLGHPYTQSQTHALLDQLWINFDLAHTVFVTAGRQHVKWGTGRFWNPTDYLHPVRRDPLAQFDTRTGVTMVKAHLPLESHGFNLYGMAVLEDLAGESVQHAALLQSPAPNDPGALGHTGGAARLEGLLGPVEVAVDVAAQQGHRPRFGLDGTFAVGEVDVHFEGALRNGKDAPRWVLTPGANPADYQSWVPRDPSGPTAAVVVGAEWSYKYSDEDSLTVGAEYFHDQSGYATARVYPVLLASSVLLPADPRVAFTPFYLGRDYAGVYLSLPKPGSWNDTTFTLTALANLSDGSGIVRLDHSVLLNTYLTLETYLAGHLGHEGGEFRFGFTLPAAAGLTTSPVTVPTAVLDAGVALRVKL